MLEINGMRFEFDMSDADTYEKYMSLAEKVDEVTGKTLGEEHSTEEYVALTREKCQAVREFVEAVLGDGAGEKLCPTDSWKNCGHVLDAIIEDVYRQVEENVEQEKTRAKLAESRKAKFSM